MANPLVAEREDSTKSFSGVPILESVDETKKAIESGDWAAGVMGATGTALDALGMAMDPFGSIFAAGVGWLMEHVGPLSDALDSLTGDPDEIKAHSETWKNIATELDGVGADLQQMVGADIAEWSGKAADAYRKRSEETGTLISAAKSAADGAADGIGTAGEVVAAVRTLVRDIIAELVGHLISWALQVLATAGIGMAWVLPQVAVQVTKVATKIAELTMKLVKAMKALMPLLKKLGKGFGDAAKELKKIKSDGSSGGGPKPTGGDRSRGGSDGPASNHSSNAENKPGGTPPPRGDGPASNHSSNAEGSPAPGPNNGGSGRGNGGGNGGGPTPTPTPPPRGGKGPASTRSTSSNNTVRDQGTNSRSLQNSRCVGDPIDVSSGQMMLAQTDAEFLAALPLVVERTHLSAFRAGRAFGPSWVSTLDQRVEVDEQGVVLVAADGVLQHFPHPAVGSWVFSDGGPRRPLGRAEDGAYVLDDQQQRQVLRFAGAGAGATCPLTSISDHVGNRIDFLHDEHGTPREIRHSGGYRVLVDTADGLVTSLRSATADGDVELMRYGYTGDRLTEVVNASGQPMCFDYDHVGRITGWTDRNGEWYRYHYDHEGRCVRTEGSGGFLTCGMEFDTENRITRSTDSLGNVTTFRMNEAGQVVEEIDPLGASTTSEWDRHDNLLRRTDPLGRSIRYDRDERGNVLAITRPDGSRLRCEYDESGLPIAVVEADGTTTRHTYDELGNIRTTTDPCGATTTYRYDERGALASVTDALGGTSTVEVDASGLPVALRDPLGAVTRYERDRFGRVTSITDPVGGVQRFGWTVGGELAWHERADGTVERRVHDGEGNLREHRDEFSEVSTTEITHFDLVAAEVRPDGTRLEFGYDTEMRLTSVTDPQGLVWRYEYDAAGRLVRETDFNGRTLQYAYDAAGRLVERTNGAGEVTRFGLDVLGNIVERRTASDVARFTLSETGEILEAVNGTSRVTFQHDPAGRVIAETVNGRTVTSEYDLLGRRIRRRTPSGAESTWEYDANDQPIALHSAGRTLRFEYDRAGREVRRSTASGLVFGQSWTATHLLQTQTIAGAGGRIAQQRTYAYRADGALTGVQDGITGPRTFTLDHAGKVLGVQGSGWSERYAYDATGNITHGSWPASGADDEFGDRAHTGTLLRAAGGARYEYDAQGRMVLRQRKRLSHRPETWRYSWDGDDRLVGVLTPDGTRWAYHYDAIGRRITKQRLGPDGTTVVAGVDFSWDGHVLAEQAEYRQGQPGPLVLVWDHEPESFRPLTQAERVLRGPQDWVDSKFHAIVTDAVGTPTELVDEHGVVSWVSRTTLWGGAPGAEAVTGTPLRFPGQYYDAETGLHYNFYRYYDPLLARYVSPDPLGLDGGLNQHAYVPNPHSWTDPLGLKCERRMDGDMTRHRINDLADKFKNKHQDHGPGRQGLDNHIFKGGTKASSANSPSGLHAYEKPAGRHEKIDKGSWIDQDTGKSDHLPKDVTVLARRGNPNKVHEIMYVRDGLANDGKGLKNTKVSTMFPANWSQNEVRAYIAHNKSGEAIELDYKGSSKTSLQQRIDNGDPIKVKTEGDTTYPQTNATYGRVGNTGVNDINHPSWKTTTPGDSYKNR